MNLSGNAVRYWMDKLKLPLENLIVICDDLNASVRHDQDAQEWKRWRAQRTEGHTSTAGNHPMGQNKNRDR